MATASLKGENLEHEFADWMKSNLGYSKTEMRVPIKGKVSERSYEVDIHAIKYSKLMNTIGIVGFILLAVAGYGYLTNNEEIGEIAARLVRAISPDEASNALVILGVVGLIGGLWGRSKTKVHAWVECKDQKSNVKRQQIQKLISSVEDVRALEEPKWRPKQVFLVSGEDFDPDALNFAREYDVMCYRRTPDGFELVCR